MGVRSGRETGCPDGRVVGRVAMSADHPALSAAFTRTRPVPTVHPDQGVDLGSDHLQVPRVTVDLLPGPQGLAEGADPSAWGLGAVIPKE